MYTMLMMPVGLTDPRFKASLEIYDSDRQGHECSLRRLVLPKLIHYKRERALPAPTALVSLNWAERNKPRKPPKDAKKAADMLWNLDKTHREGRLHAMTQDDDETTPPAQRRKNSPRDSRAFPLYKKKYSASDKPTHHETSPFPRVPQLFLNLI